MRSVINFVVSVLLLGGIFFLFRGTILPAKPCAEPIPYALGAVAREFGLSEQNLIGALKEAEAVWEKSSGRDLFTQVSPDSHKSDLWEKKILLVNLVYDYRQQATEKLKGLGIAVENNRNSYDSLRARFEAEKKDYEKNVAAFEARVAAFNTRQKKYNDEVKSWNDKGGAPQGEYERLEAEREALEAEAAALEKAQNRLNDQAEEVNALVVTINRLARTLNLSVEKYNDVSTSRGETFEEGLYVSRGSEHEINIYEFADRAELVRVLAHELGHALRLEHVADPEAIMYEYNQSESLKPTAADLAALEAICGPDQP